MNVLTSYHVALILALATTAKSTTTIRRGDLQYNIGTRRSSGERGLYGFEFGMKGYESIMENENNQNDYIFTSNNNGAKTYSNEVRFGSESDNIPKEPSLQTRIVGGEDSTVQPGFVMQLDWDSKAGSWHFGGCGGSLITPCHVLTAGHCVEGSENEPDGLYVSAYQPFEGNPGVPYFFSTPKDIVIHPDFSDPRNLNDIAIIELTECIAEEDLNTFTPMSIPPKSFTIDEGTTATVMGFGSTAFVDGILPTTLQQVDVPIYNRDDCKESYPNRIEPDMFCAGYANGGKDSCRGDSGGPLVLNPTANSPTQIGIVSWGYQCAAPGRPGVYASTAYHYDFIIANTCNHDEANRFDLCSGILPKATPIPSSKPSSMPTLHPSVTPTISPTKSPSASPTTMFPSWSPSYSPTLFPSSIPSSAPSDSPSLQPSTEPSTQPSLVPSLSPSMQPSFFPSYTPTLAPHERASSPGDNTNIPLSMNVPTQSPSDNEVPTASPVEDFATNSEIVPSSAIISPSTMPSLAPSFPPSVQPSRLRSPTVPDSSTDVPTKKTSEEVTDGNAVNNIEQPEGSEKGFLSSFPSKNNQVINILFWIALLFLAVAIFIRWAVVLKSKRNLFLHQRWLRVE